MTNDGKYTLLTARLLAKEIVNKIKPDTFYSIENEKYPGAPPTKILRRVNGFEEYVLKCFDDSKEKIEIHNLRYNMGGLYGLYDRQKHIRYVIINSKNNVCWNRFARLKELCSIYIDHYKQHTTNTNYLKAIDDAFSQKNFLTDTHWAKSPDMDSESYSIIVATELMIPIYDRHIIRDYFKKISNNELTYNDLAKALIMPEYILKAYHTSKLIDMGPQYDDI